MVTNAVKKYRKKPVVIEAMEVTYESAMDVFRWIEQNSQGAFDFAGTERPEIGVGIDPADGRMVIATLEGDMHVSLGDYVIRGVQGEFYPCKPDIFRATYDAVNEGVES